MLQSKLKMLNHDCTKFNAAFKRAHRNQKSGECEVDILKQANQLYRDDHNNTPFSNEEAWSVLGQQQKWNTTEAVYLTSDVPS